MSPKKNNDTEDLLTLMFLGTLVLGGIGYIYKQHAQAINTPIVNISYAVLKIVSVITPDTSFANRITQQVSRQELAQLTIDQAVAINHAAGHYVKYLVLFYATLLIIYIHRRPGKHRYQKRLSIEQLIRKNVRFTPCLAPIVYRNPNDESGNQAFKPALTPLQFALHNQLIINKSTAEIIPIESLLFTNETLNPQSAIIREYTPLLLMPGTIDQIIEQQLGTTVTQQTALPPYLSALVAAFHAMQKDPKKGQAILNELSLSFLNKQPMKSVKLQQTLAQRYHQAHPNITIDKPINWYLATCFANINPPLSTTQFIWLKGLDRPCWYALNQVGQETHWSESLAVGLAMHQPTINREQLKAALLQSLCAAIKEKGFNIRLI